MKNDNQFAVEPNLVVRFLPGVVIGLALLYLIMSLALMPTDKPGEPRIHAYSRLPVVADGRVKPMDTLARTSLMLISRRQYYVDDQGNAQPAIRWLLDVMGSRGDDHKVFYIENDQVLDLLDLPERKGFRYAVSEFGDKFAVLQREVERIQKLAPEQPHEVFDDKVMELARRFKLYMQLRDQLDLSIYQKVRENQQHLRSYISHLMEERTKTPHLVPMPDGDWQTFPLATILAVEANEDLKAVPALLNMEMAYVGGNSQRFNDELDKYNQWLVEERPDEVRRASLEVFFNDFSPFSHCYLLYVIVALLGVMSWIALPLAGRPWMDALNRSAFWLCVLTLAVHTFGMIARMVIQGRPPVTNLYSSAVYIGWCAVILGLIIERIFRIGIGNVIAGALGFATTLIAYHLAELQPSSATGLRGGDTMEMLQAVLDTNFWLWTHVTCITFGYSATFVAGLVGVVFIGLGLFTPLLNREWWKVLGQVMYGIVCFATFLSFTGTVLGGIWADQSWGRFWGWDPKENGALLIVIWNAMILHARWSGLIKTRGMAVLCVAGNIITAWSWFGTNQLPVGLHSYGRNDLLADGLKWFWLSQVVIIGIGMTPLRFWSSNGLDAPTAKKPGKRSDGPVAPSDDAPPDAIKPAPA